MVAVENFSKVFMHLLSSHTQDIVFTPFTQMVCVCKQNNLKNTEQILTKLYTGFIMVKITSWLIFLDL